MALAKPDQHKAGSAAEQVGEFIGPYRLLEKIGEGGFGVVYMAEQREPVVRRVALKILKLGMDTKQVIARFEAERQALALMDHPNIARILDAGATQSGRPYFVMELVRGVPVTRFCQENKLERDDRLTLFLDVCAAVQHAHQKGVIHRDLKPSNVLVTMNADRPMPKVIDFGIAKAISGKLTNQTLFTQFHQFIGTPAYMSPEQAQMDATDVDTRTDVYALGVLLYELLTGTPPFDPDRLRTAGQEAVFRIIREETPPKPSTRQRETTAKAVPKGTVAPPRLKGIPRDLDWVVMRALEKDRKRRYETASGLGQDIARFLNKEPVSAAAPSLAYHCRRFLARHRAAALTTCLVLVTLLAGLVVATAFYLRERAARIELAEAEYATDMQALRYEFDRGLAGLALERLKKHVPDPDETTKDPREWLWRYRMGQLHREVAWTKDIGRGGLALSPDGQKAARIGKGKVNFFRVDGLNPGPSVEVPTTWTGGFFAPNGQELITRSPIPMVVDLEKLATRPLMLTMEEEPNWATLPTPDGKWAIGVFRDGRRFNLRTFEVATGQIVHQTETLTAPDQFWFENEIIVSPDSQFVAYCAGDRSVRVLGVPELDEVARLPTQDDPNGVTWSPDGERLAICYEYPADVEVWHVPSQSHLSTLETRLKEPKTFMAFSPDGKRLAAALAGQAIVVWDVESGEVVEEILGYVGKVAFLPDGRLLAESGRWVKLFELSADEPLTALRNFSGDSEIWKLAYSNDGALLAATARDGVVRLFDAETEALVYAFPARPKIEGEPIRSGGGLPLAFAPDNRTLVAANRDHTASVLDIHTREQKFLLEGHAGAIADIAISADGEMVVTTGEDEAMIAWDLQTGEERERRPPPGGPKRVDFSPINGSKLLAYRDETGFGLRDFNNPRNDRYLKTDADIWAFKFTPDGKQLIVGKETKESWLYDVSTFERIGSLPPVVGAVKLSFTPDGRNLALPTWGWGTHLWQMETGQSLGPIPFPEPGAWVYSAVFSPDGNTLAISARKFGVHLLRAPSFTEIDEWN
ncbi:MAG: serine/threonine-protein kinase [Verrucomicrobiales bacterium]